MEDPQIEQLKELVRQNIALTQETNKMLRGMRSAGRLKSFFWIIVFLASTAVSLYTYFYFVAPRIEQIKTIYQTNIAPIQNSGSSVFDFFKSFGSTTQ